MYCTYTYKRNQHGFFDRPTVKTEVLNTKPLIIVFRDVFNASVQKAVAHLGYEQVKHYVSFFGIVKKKSV